MSGEKRKGFPDEGPHYASVPSVFAQPNANHHPAAAASAGRVAAPAAYTFVRKPPPRFDCPVCHDVMTAPMLSKTCGHSYCDRCIRSCLSYKRDCPVCRGACNANDLIKALFIEESISELEVMCPNGVSRSAGHSSGHGVLGVEFKVREGGCTAVLRARDLPAHLRACGQSIENDEVRLKVARLQEEVASFRRHAQGIEQRFAAELAEARSEAAALRAVLAQANETAQKAAAALAAAEQQRAAADAEARRLKQEMDQLLPPLTKFPTNRDGAIAFIGCLIRQPDNLPAPTRNTLFNMLATFHVSVKSLNMTNDDDVRYARKVDTLLTVAISHCFGWTDAQWYKLMAMLREVRARLSY